MHFLCFISFMAFTATWIYLCLFTYFLSVYSSLHKGFFYRLFIFFFWLHCVSCGIFPNQGLKGGQHNESLES